MGKPSKCSFLSHCLSLATMKTWKLISIFVAIPGCLLCAYNAVLKEKEHHTHPRPEFLPYSHLRLRKKVGEEVFEIFPSYRISHIWWPYGKCTRLWIKWLRLVLCLGMLCCVLKQDTLFSQCLSLHKCLKWVPANLILGCNSVMD